MKRLTSDNVFEMNMTELALNQVFVQDGWAWYRKGPEDECSVCDLIRSAATKGLWQEGIELDPNLTDEELGDVMLDWLQFGEAEPEGVLAILYRALWAMAEVRERLKLYENICFAVGGTELITPDRLQEVRAGLRNDPLTPEQLQKMDGDPVWTITLGTENSGRWELCSCEVVTACPLHKVLRCVTAAGEATDYELNTYGKTWLAYRRKPGEYRK